MFKIVLSLIWWFSAFLCSRYSLRPEIVALRQQLSVLKRKNPRSRLSPWDQVFCVVLRWVSSAKNLVATDCRSLFMTLPSPVGIPDVDRPGGVFLPLVDYTEDGDLKFVAPECPPEGSGMPGSRLECGRPRL